MERGLPPLEHDEFVALREVVHEVTGIALSNAKHTLVQTRLAKRLRELGMRDFASYVRHVQHDMQGEREALIAAMTTHTTHWWRERHHFDDLRKLVLEPARARRAKKLRIWSAAASSGEEPYCLAFSAAAALDTKVCDVKILATDIDPGVLQRAERGVYDAATVAEHPDLAPYFTAGSGENQGLAQVKPAYRELLRFRRLNLIDTHWPVRAVFDAIFIRNVLIYFDEPTQLRVATRLAEHLLPGGILVFGHSESMLGVRAGLRQVGRGAFSKGAL